MRRNSTSSMGALHPVLFFLFVYGLSLFLALFVCRTVYYSVNGNEPEGNNTSVQAEFPQQSSGMTATALR